VGIRGACKTSDSRIIGTRHRTKIMKMRISGLTLSEIATKCKVTVPRIHRIITEELQKELTERKLAASELANIEFSRLEAAYKAIHARVAKGELAAINIMIRLSERMSRLMGLDLDKDTGPTGNAPIVLNISEMVVENRGQLNGRHLTEGIDAEYRSADTDSPSSDPKQIPELESPLPRVRGRNRKRQKLGGVV
jgi:hypothetical protein